MKNDVRGFTLIEILVVISILGILLAIVTFSGVGVRGGAQVTKEEAAVQQLNLAFSLYQNAFDSYPSSPTNCSMCALQGSNQTAAETAWNEVVMVLAPQYISTSISTDVWGNPYGYDRGDSGRYVALCSMGPDGVLQTATADYLISSGAPTAQGDDICFFAI